MTAPIHSCYELHLEHRVDEARDRLAGSLSHIYTAEDAASAVRDALAFWKGRNAAMPEYFSELYACKVYPLKIGPLTDGRAFNGRGFALFEYKIDTAGIPRDEYFEMRAEQLKS